MVGVHKLIIAEIYFKKAGREEVKEKYPNQ